MDIGRSLFFLSCANRDERPAGARTNSTHVPSEIDGRTAPFSRDHAANGGRMSEDKNENPLGLAPEGVHDFLEI
jgi:hypothetical protein